MRRSAILGAVVLLLAATAQADPYRPSDPDAVLFRDDVAQIDVVQRRAAQEARTRATTGKRDARAALEAARRDVALGRANLDERYFGQAEAALRSVLTCVRLAPLDASQCAHDADTVDLLVVLADVLQHRHEFQTAEALLSAAIARSGAHTDAHLMRATVRIANGRPGEALADCRALVLRVDALVTTACIAQSLSLSGKLSEAHALLTRAVTDAEGSRDPVVAWALGILADLAERRGNAVDAAALARRALAIDPSSYPLRLQTADLLLAGRDYAGARDTLESLPPLEPVVLRRALIAQHEGDVKRARELTAEWMSLSQRERELGTPLHLRDLARGRLELLGDAHGAVRAAHENWQSQREVADARVLIAAAARAGRPDDARDAREWIEANHIEDVVIARTIASGASL
jgi:predicted Zn-dependent protease